ncbi:hypothetical protein F5879DRAFT_633954 [Lentinula edodes]|nr:hypothetical protein F5879DRAFT_633954 [Lentinula edodes]
MVLRICFQMTPRRGIRISLQIRIRRRRREDHLLVVLLLVTSHLPPKLPPPRHLLRKHLPLCRCLLKGHPSFLNRYHLPLKRYQRKHSPQCDSSSPSENETNDNEAEKAKEKAKTEADAKEEEAEEEKEVDSDTELLPSNASSSAKLELSLDLLKQINGLRKVQKEGDGYDKQIAKQIRKLERRVERISNTDWTSSKESNTLEVSPNLKIAIEEIEDRLWKLLTNKDARNIGYTRLEVTMPKAAKGNKSKTQQFKSAMNEALDRSVTG